MTVDGLFSHPEVPRPTPPVPPADDEHQLLFLEPGKKVGQA
ncbi:hypothetical protein AB0425_38810 [Actinosynnema sp. NPDC051121]